MATVRAVSERCLVPVLEELIKSCPFKVLGFHADNGSEYVNHRVADMLNRLQVPEFTKSRARRSNDNALVESKNGNVVGRCFGYGHIPKLFARECNALARDVLNPFLNFHRPCLFATEVIDKKGKNTAISIIRLDGRFPYLPQAHRHYAAKQGDAMRQVTRRLFAG